ncbi:hypothetical protein [Methylobacterium trifolii]|uniref:hypothetical protein n=1 Tax=Methylobacterium trifolii TaxID=1003092 RepID=UPI001EE13B6A|nr:hypothetical protein [Methylobacterium trifolii]
MEARVMEETRKFLSDTDDDDFGEFRMTLLESRVRALEHIIHSLLRDRVVQEKADHWLDLADISHSIVTCTSIINGLGREIASEIDKNPDKQLWQTDPRKELIKVGVRLSD